MPWTDSRLDACDTFEGSNSWIRAESHWNRTPLIEDEWLGNVNLRYSRVRNESKTL